MSTSTNTNTNTTVVEPLNQRPRVEDVQLADFFPTTKKECREVAARFFFCFTTNGEMKSDQVSHIHELIIIISIFCGLFWIRS